MVSHILCLFKYSRCLQHFFAPRAAGVAANPLFPLRADEGPAGREFGKILRGRARILCKMM